LIEDSYALYKSLEKKGLLKNKPFMWWPEYGSFEVVVGAILTQNTQWTRVEVSLENLRQNNVLSLEGLCEVPIEKLQDLIKPSGLFKTKARYLQTLALSIKEEFGSFEKFSVDVDRVWLLKSKGVGAETADSILCYACKRNAMVVDAYTSRLLNALGYEFGSYINVQSWCIEGLKPWFKEGELVEIYALFHGMIVEFVKKNSIGKKIDIESLR